MQKETSNSCLPQRKLDDVRIKIVMVSQEKYLMW